jgi:hypothetical protein
MYKYQRYLLCLLFIFLFSACDSINEPVSLFDQYSERLARVLEQDEINTEIMPLERIPRPRERRYEIPQFSTNILGFLSLYGCELQVLIGERNSILGKVMSPLNQLDYDLQFIVLAQACRAQIDQADVEIRDLLNQSIDYKRTQLPLSVWNALWADEEVANLLSYSHGYYPLENEPHNKHIILGSLAHQLDELDAVMRYKQTRLDKNSLLQLQKEWLYEPRVGQLLMSLQMVTQKLNDATQIINQRMQRRAICFKQKTNPKAERMRQFFFNFYIVHIQTYVALLHQQAEVILPQLNRMASIYTAPTPVFEQYRQAILAPDSESGLWQKFELAIKRHTVAWQEMLEQCGMRPGQK